MRRVILATLLVGAAGLLAACGGSDTDNLTGRTWYLVAGSEADPPWQWTVPLDQQANYTVAFAEDGTFSATADCNQLAGTWEAGRSNALEIVPGPMTMAFCGEGSFDVLYAGILGQAASFATAGTSLDIALADGGKLQYTSVTPTVTPAPESPSPEATEPATEAPTATASPEPTSKPTATPTATPRETARPTATPRPTAAPTAAPTPKPTPAPTPRPTPAPTPPPSPGQGLVGPTWQLSAVALRNPPFQGTVPNNQRASYDIRFAADGTFAARADCNTLNGEYTTADATAASGDLAIVPGPASLVMCSEGSYSDLYITAISSAASYTIRTSSLVITLSDGGTLEYAAAP